MLGFSPIASGPISSIDQGGTLIFVSADFAVAYSISAYVSANYSIAYAVENAVAQVSADFGLSYLVRAFVSADFDIDYGVSANVTAMFALAYSVQAETNYARAPAGTGYAPRRAARSNRPRDIQGYCR